MGEARPRPSFGLSFPGISKTCVAGFAMPQFKFSLKLLSLIWKAAFIALEVKSSIDDVSDSRSESPSDSVAGSRGLHNRKKDSNHKNIGTKIYFVTQDF